MSVLSLALTRLRGHLLGGETAERPARRQQSSRPAAGPAAPPAAGRVAAPRVTGTADPILTATVVALVAFGVVMVYSASAVYANRTFGDGLHYLVRQSAFAAVGLVLMVGAARIDYHAYRALTYPILAGALGLLLFVAAGFGHRAGGAARWISLGPVHIQPAEVAKLAVILWMAYSLSKKQEQIRSFSVGFLPHALMAGLLMLLCLLQPDFGSAVMIGLLTFLMMFVAGAKTGYLVGAAVAALPVAYALIATSDYRMRRIIAYQNPFEHRNGIGYQIAESLMSFGTGGVTGVGIGDSRQKLFFLPEAHTDFIGAIIGEELGFLGVLCVVVAFAVVVARGLRAAFHAADDYGAWLAVGITAFIGLQAFTNLAVEMGMLPTKGLALPFLSYGGSSLLVNCTAVGILLNVSREREAPAGSSEDEDAPRAKGASRGARRNSALRAKALSQGGRA